MKRDSFIFYRSFFESIEKLKKKDQLTLFSYICRYALGEETEKLDGVAAAIFDLIKPQIDANTRRYEGGKKGGRPKTKEKPIANLGVTISEPNVNENVNVNVNENENVNVNVNAPAHPAATTDNTAQSNKPVFLEIAADIKTNGYDLDEKDIEEFIDFNDKLGWIGDWKRHLKSWAEHKKPKREAKPKGSFYNFDQHDKDMSGEEREIVLANMREAEDYEQRNMG